MKNDYADYFKLLNLPYGDNIIIDRVEVIDNIKHIYLHTAATPTFCPDCGSRMHSDGLKKRNPIHPIYQDGTNVILHINQRRWSCPSCGLSQNEQFPFLLRYKRYTSITPYLILQAMKDLNRSTKSIADQFYISDTEVHDIFTSYVDLKRLPLPEYISIDEVYLDIDDESKYAFVIMDFVTGEIVDIVHNRWKDTLEQYFSRIPKKERRNVKAVIADAYETYQIVCEKFFPKALMILDSFHVINFIIQRLNNYIYSVQKKYKDRLAKELETKNLSTNKDNKSIKDSPELILLRNYKWFLLKNKDEIDYNPEYKYNKRLGMNLTTYQLENMFMAVDKNFKELRDLKEQYISFNNNKFSTEKEAIKELNKLITIYRNSNHKMFREFAEFLNDHSANIARSFTTVQVSRKTKTR